MVVQSGSRSIARGIVYDINGGDEDRVIRGEKTDETGAAIGTGNVRERRIVGKNEQ